MNELDSQDDRYDETLSGDHDEIFGNVDECVNTWLDRNAVEPIDAIELASMAALDSLDPPLARRVADLQFLHVLLNELHRNSAQLNSARVQRAMAAIHQEPSFTGDAAVVAHAAEAPANLAGAESTSEIARNNVATHQRRLWARGVNGRRSWFISAAAIAATLTGVMLWLTLGTPGQTVYAAVQRVAAEARILNDRQYRVTQTLNFDRGQQGRVESRLYVRGGEKFVLRHRGPLGIVWMGSNGREGWLIPALGPPIITDNPRYPARWAREEGLALPDLKLTGLIDLMKERFQLSLLLSEALPDRPNIRCQRISGRCNSRDGGANRIELWAHPDTGVAQRLVLEWDRSPDEVGLTGIQLDLLEEASQPDSFYEVDEHRHPRPTLRRIPILPAAP